MKQQGNLTQTEQGIEEQTVARCVVCICIAFLPARMQNSGQQSLLSTQKNQFTNHVENRPQGNKGVSKKSS